MFSGVHLSESGSLASQVPNSRSRAAIRRYASLSIGDEEEMERESMFSVILPASSIRSSRASYISVSMGLSSPVGFKAPRR